MQHFQGNCSAKDETFFFFFLTSRLHRGENQTGRLPLLRLRHRRGLRDGGHPLQAGVGAAAQRPGHVQPGLHAREGLGHQTGGMVVDNGTLYVLNESE